MGLSKPSGNGIDISGISAGIILQNVNGLVNNSILQATKDFGKIINKLSKNYSRTLIGKSEIIAEIEQCQSFLDVPNLSKAAYEYLMDATIQYNSIQVLDSYRYWYAQMFEQLNGEDLTKARKQLVRYTNYNIIKSTYLDCKNLYQMFGTMDNLFSTLQSVFNESQEQALYYTTTLGGEPFNNGLSNSSFMNSQYQRYSGLINSSTLKQVTTKPTLLTNLTSSSFPSTVYIKRENGQAFSINLDKEARAFIYCPNGLIISDSKTNSVTISYYTAI